MTLNGKIATYTMFFLIIIVFLGIGYNSVCQTRTVELDPKTECFSRLIKINEKLEALSEELYQFVNQSSKMNPQKVVMVEDLYSEKETFTQMELAKGKVNKIFKTSNKMERLIERIAANEVMENYQESTVYYLKAANLISESSENILLDFENKDCSKVLVPSRDAVIQKLGKNNYRVRLYLSQARKKMKD
jgi:hypothetical protein